MRTNAACLVLAVAVAGASAACGETDPGDAASLHDAGDRTCSLLTVCGLACSCEPLNLAQGVLHPTQIAPVDMAFSAVLDLELRRTSAHAAIELHLAALRTDLALDADADLAEDLEPLLAAHLDEPLTATATTAECPFTAEDVAQIHAACSDELPLCGVQAALFVECNPPAVTSGEPQLRADLDEETGTEFLTRLQAAQHDLPGLLAATARAERIRQAALELAAFADDEGPIARLIDEALESESLFAKRGAPCARDQLPFARAIAQGAASSLQADIDRARAVAAALGVEVEEP